MIQRRETYADLVRRDEGIVRPELQTPEQAVVFSNAARRSAKYNALGNDYIVLDPMSGPIRPRWQPSAASATGIAGVGSDGVLWGPVGRDPFGLRLFNPDGSEFEKSGNGLRIFARYLWDRGLPLRPRLSKS